MNEFGPKHHTICKNDLKMYQRLNVKMKIINLLEGNVAVNFHDLRLGNGFLNMTIRAYATKEN